MYFKGLTINHKHPDFRNFKWLIKARDKDLSFRNCICFDEQSWAATDGHRLHVFDPPGNIYEQGLYEIIAENKFGIILKQTTQDISIYPDYKHLLDYKHINRLPDVVLETLTIDISYTRLVRLLPEDKTIQYKYFQDMMYLDILWEIYLLEDNKNVFSFDNHIGIIMPMRM